VSIRLHVKYRHSCQILMKLKFSQDILKNTQIPNFMKIRPVGAELFHIGRMDGRMDRQTDRQTLQSQRSLFAIFRTRLKP
jgi:hypothetical protein